MYGGGEGVSDWRIGGRGEMYEGNWANLKNSTLLNTRYLTVYLTLIIRAHIQQSIAGITCDII